MRIQWIELKNLKTGLEIERIYFNKDITLLVGLSGAGKTQILKAVEYSLGLAVDKDEMLYPYSVGMGLLIDDEEYEWYYEINKVNEESLIIEEENKYEFVYEKLVKKSELIFERKTDSLFISGYDRVPRPKRDESLISQYSQDRNFKKLVSEMRKLYSVEMELAVRGRIKTESFGKLKAKLTEIFKENKNTKFKIFSHLPPEIKIYIAKNYYPDLYDRIFDAVKDIFIEIEDIDVEEDAAREICLVSIQVYGKKLLQDDISNGMLKTIYYIVELYTMAENALVLIDEFENGLGVNCIDVLSELILNEREDLQFIITSHHPKIISSIEKEKWKIIQRDAETVKNCTSEEYGIGNSQHDAYFNLINRWEFVSIK